MRLRKLHKVLGLAMVVPLLLWAITGVIFLTKPGYGSAYEQLAPRLYPFDRPLQLAGANSWSQIKALKTVLGHHLLVLEGGRWKHLDPFTLKIRPQPGADEVRALVADAVASHPQRYGSITSVEGATVFTDTDVVITLNWETLSLQQTGSDTRLIDALYRVHYLQWFSSPVLNQVLGVVGLGLLVALSLVGLRLFVGAARHVP